jgi:hypothetical protein
LSGSTTSFQNQATTCARPAQGFRNRLGEDRQHHAGPLLPIAGYNHQGQNLSLVLQIQLGDFSKTLHIAAAKDGFGDWPWISIFRKLDQSFPAASSSLQSAFPIAG